jgi:glucose-1-phosphate cytidylyltransferase
MKAMILAGGFGTRLSEETDVRPKPMVEIGGRPILWHIMHLYSKHGINDFVVCAGYKGEYIKKFFLDYAVSLSDFTVDLASHDVHIHRHRAENWKITVVDTGIATMTGGRMKRAIKHVDPDEPFCLTYGDGLSNVDIRASIEFHKAHGKLATVTAVTPPGRFGVLDVKNDGSVTGFREKIASDQYRINGGFFVLDPKVADFIEGDEIVWEQEPMTRLATAGQMRAWNHDGFWQSMDTLREKQLLENLWASGTPPWREPCTVR